MAYGHVKESEGIDGLELLDEHFAAMRKEANGGVSDDSDAEAHYPDEDDEAGWDNWDLESESGSESSGWEEVSDGDDDLVISDSEDDQPQKKKLKVGAAADAEEVKTKGKGKRVAEEEEEPQTKKLKVGGEEVEAEAEPAIKTKTKAKANGKGKRAAESDQEDEDSDDEADAKSVVSMAPSAATEASVATKKLSLLAQQKVSLDSRFSYSSTHARTH